MTKNANTEPIESLGAVVLCGGKSTRLGIDKTQLIFQGQTFLERVVNRVSAICSPVVLVGDTDFSKQNLPNNILLETDEQFGKGPLEGIRVGLKRLSGLADMAFVTSCDVPLLQSDLIRHLHQNLGQYQAAVPFEADRIFGMTAIYRTELHQPIGLRIDQNQLRVSDLASAFSTNHVDVETLRSVDPDLDSMTNINSAKDYFALLKRFGLACPDQFASQIDDSAD